MVVVFNPKQGGYQSVAPRNAIEEVIDKSQGNSVNYSPKTIISGKSTKSTNPITNISESNVVDQPNPIVQPNQQSTQDIINNQLNKSSPTNFINDLLNKAKQVQATGQSSRLGDFLIRQEKGKVLINDSSGVKYSMQDLEKAKVDSMDLFIKNIKSGVNELQNVESKINQKLGINDLKNKALSKIEGYRENIKNFIEKRPEIQKFNSELINIDRRQNIINNQVKEFNEKYGGKELNENEYTYASRKIEDINIQQKNLDINKERLDKKIELVNKKYESTPLAFGSSVVESIVSTPLDIAELTIKATTPIKSSKELIKGVANLPKAIANNPLPVVGSLVGGIVAGEAIGAVVKGTNIITRVSRYKPIVESAEIEFSDAVKIGKNPDGSNIWKVETYVNTKVINPKTLEVVDNVKTIGKSIVVTGTDEAGAIKSASETVASSIRKGGERVYKDLSITQKFDVTKSKGTLTLTEGKNGLLEGTAQSNIKQVGTLRLKKTSDNIISNLRKVINPAEYRSLSNVIVKPISETEEIRNISNGVQAQGTSSKSISKTLSNVSENKLRVKGYNKIIGKAKINKREIRIKPYVRKPRVEPKGETIKSYGFNKSFEIKSVEVDLDKIGFKPQELELKGKESKSASSLAQAQTTEIAKVNASKPIKVITKEVVPTRRGLSLSVKSVRQINIVPKSEFYGKGTYERTESEFILKSQNKDISVTNSLTNNKSLIKDKIDIKSGGSNKFKDISKVDIKINNKLNNNIKEKVLNKSRQDINQLFKQRQRDLQVTQLRIREIQKNLQQNRERSRPSNIVRIPLNKIPRNKLDDNKNKKVTIKSNSNKGFDTYVKRQGKFIRVNPKPFINEQQAKGFGFKVAKNNLSQSIITLPSNRGEALNSQEAQNEFTRFSKEFRPSKRLSNVSVQRNPLSSRTETFLIQQAKKEELKKQVSKKIYIENTKERAPIKIKSFGLNNFKVKNEVRQYTKSELNRLDKQSKNFEKKADTIFKKIGAPKIRSIK